MAMQTSHTRAFGELLRHYRTAAGLTQEELAERAGLSSETISLLERGARRRPHPYTVQQLSAALGLGAPECAALAAARREHHSAALARDREEIPAAPGRPLLSLIGRAPELALLGRHRCGGGPPVVVLAGEPGIGKSHLLQEAAQRALESGWRVLEGGCQRRGEQEPYAPLLEALHRSIQRQGNDQLGTSLHGCAWLVKMLPELASGPIEPLPAWTLPPEQERRLVIQAVGRFLANVAGPAGTLLVLDDLQWAGADALDLLAALVRSAAEVPLRVLGAYRETEVQPPDPLSTLLADLAHAGLALHHRLGPLAPEEARRLLDGLLAGAVQDNALRERVVQRAEGVPFFVVSWAQGLQAGALGGHGPGAVPWDVAQGIRQRVAALPTPARAVLSAAAVAGRVVHPALLTAMVTQPEEEVLGALEAASRSGLLAAEEQGYRFAHDVIREVVEAESGPALRRALHRRVAETLEQEAGVAPVELLAYHYGRSGNQDKAVLYLERAGDRAQGQAAYAAAETYYRAVVECLEALERPLDAARAREKLGAVLQTMARYEAALAVLDQAAATYQAAADLEGLAWVTAQIGRVHAHQGTPEEGVARLEPLRAALEARGLPHGLAALEAALAYVYFRAGRYDAQLAAAERAAELARTAADDWLLTEAEAARGGALLHLGRVEEACAVLEVTIQLAEATGNRGSLGAALTDASCAYGVRGDSDTALRYSQCALEVAEQVGEAAQIVTLRSFRGLLAYYQGAWAQARAECERAVALSRQIGAPYVCVAPLTHLARVCLAAGAWDEAVRHLEECLPLTARSNDLEALRAVQWLLAEGEILAGRPAAACARLAPLSDHPGLEGDYLWPRLAWAHLECGELGRAQEVLAQALRQARGHQNRVALVEILRVQALAAIRMQQWEATAQALEEALSLTRGMFQGYPYVAARLEQAYGLMHVQKGEPGPARERLEAALALFHGLGARKEAEQVLHLLGSLHLHGCGGRPAVTTGPVAAG